ncbi:outer membrane protein assembly factor BamB [Halomonas sp. CUBES01]|uniref:Outer membrane protein assembly factor BamB n=1 Tax=Vreelandella gomseomensis TaxID=370766 RepID=A0ABU1GDV6_9GAMM|nr:MULTISPECIES: outer membrane protein assembly factor BamB [Halomonas]MDR5875487.1 outer membrane protein assembly factor BamB [Halomonas gomseomensis]MEC4766318.1 outer membrane protein assembly factor BamB [Halomonas sp. CUBES01]
MTPIRSTPMMRAALGAAALVLLAGCANKSEPAYTPKALTSIEESSTLESLWQRDVGDGLGRARYPIAPAREGDKLFAADANGVVISFAADDGEERWEVDLDTPISSALTAIAGQVYLGTRDGEVIALDQRDGSVSWRSRVSSEVLAAPQANPELLVVQSIDGQVTALDRQSGDERWVYTSSQPSLTLRGTGTPLVIEPVSFAGFANGRLVTIDNRNGQPLWDMRIATPQGRSEVERLVDLTGQPVLSQDGRLFVTSYNGQLVALEATRGNVIWERDISSRHAPVLVGDFLFVVTDDSHVVAIDTNNGREVWRNEALEDRWLTAPAFADGRLVVGDFEGYVHLIDAREGELVGRTEVDGSGISVPAITDGDVIHVLANDGHLETLEVSP